MADAASDSSTDHDQRASRTIEAVLRHAGDLIFAALVLFTIAYWSRVSRDSYFFIDDLPLLRMAYAGDYLQPYNDHLSVVILGMWRALAELGDGAYWPFQTAGILARCAMSVAIYIAVRLKLGPLVACVVGTLTLWAAQLDLAPAALNHYLVLIAACACAVLLDRGRRADLLIAFIVAFALMSAAGGVAVVAACLVHSACTRAPLRRWIAIVVPAALWLVWFLTMSNESSATDAQGSLLPRVTDSLVYARDLGYEATVRLVFGWSFLGVLLLVLYVAFGAWTLRRGLAHAANFVAWSAAFLVWSFGLSSLRGQETQDIAALLGVTVDRFAYRYILVALVLSILAVLPRVPVTWPAPDAERSVRTRVVAAIAVVALLGFVGVRVLATRGAVREAAAANAQWARETRTLGLLASANPSVLPEDQMLSYPMGFFLPAQVRNVRAHLGLDADLTLTEVDEGLVTSGLVSTSVIATGTRSCVPTAQELDVGPSNQIRLWSDEVAWTVSVRALGDEWVPLTEGHANQVIQVRGPELRGAGTWSVRVDAGCRVPS